MGKDGAAAAAGAVRGRSSDRLGGRCSVPERAVSAQGRASGQGARRKRPPGGGAGKRGGGRRWRRRERFARDEANGDGAVGDGAREHPTLANDVGAGRLRRGRGKAELAEAPSAGGELPDSCVRAHALPPNHRCIVWLPRLNRSATVGSSTWTLTKCVYLSVVDVACEIQYRRSIAI